MTHGEPALVRSRGRALGQKTCASSRPWGMGYTGAVIRRRLVPSLVVAVVAVVGVSSRALFAQDADADDDDDDDAAEVRPSMSDAGVSGLRGPAGAGRPRRSLLPAGAALARGRCAGAVTSCAPGESLTAAGVCARRARARWGTRHRALRGPRGDRAHGHGAGPGRGVSGRRAHPGGGAVLHRPHRGHRGRLPALRRRGRVRVPGGSLRPDAPPGLPGGERDPRDGRDLLRLDRGRGSRPRPSGCSRRGATSPGASHGGSAPRTAASRASRAAARAPSRRGGVTADRSEFGLVDVVGNVSEWTLDGPLAPRPSGGVLRDPVGGSPDGRAMVRGGRSGARRPRPSCTARWPSMPARPGWIAGCAAPEGLDPGGRAKPRPSS